MATPSRRQFSSSCFSFWWSFAQSSTAAATRQNQGGRPVRRLSHHYWSDYHYLGIRALPNRARKRTFHRVICPRSDSAYCPLRLLVTTAGGWRRVKKHHRNLISASVVSFGFSSSTQCPVSLRTTIVASDATIFIGCPSPDPQSAINLRTVFCGNRWHKLLSLIHVFASATNGRNQNVSDQTARAGC